MKKFAVFVEGHTESIFVERLLIEIAGIHNVEINKTNLHGQNRCPNIGMFNDSNAEYKILIYNSCNDAKVLSDIKDNYESLISNNYLKVIGLRDLYPRPYSRKDAIKLLIQTDLQTANFDKAEIIIATMEVETWFIGEFNHYSNIDVNLTIEYIKNNLIDLETIVNFENDITHPADTLDKIYKLKNKHWTKKQSQIIRTVNSLDYENFYCNTKNKIPSLNQLIEELDKFFH